MRKWVFHCLYALWFSSIGGVVILSLQPGVELPVNFWNADKLGHLLAYLWLALLPALIFRRLKDIILLSIALVYRSLDISIDS